MLHMVRSGVCIAALTAALGVAVAQQMPADPGQTDPAPAQPQMGPVQPVQPRSDTSKGPIVAEPEKSEQNARANKSQHSTSGRAGTSEPGAQAPSTPSTEILVDGRLTVDGAPQDSQTVPSKFSKRNAWLDSLPIMALPMPLNDAERKRIYDAVTRANAPIERSNAQPADQLPSSMTLQDLPKEIVADIPAMRGLTYVRLSDRVLLVRAPNGIVVGTIER